MATEMSKTSRFSRWLNRFFGVEERKASFEKEKKKTRPLFWKQGGGYGFGKPAWMRKKVQGIIKTGLEITRLSYKSITRADMYKKEKNGRDICVLPIGAIRLCWRNRSKYSPLTEDKKHRGLV